MRLPLRTFGLLMAALLLMPDAGAQGLSAPLDPKAEQLLKKAERQSGKRQVETLVEACELGAATGCLKAGKLATGYDPKQRLAKADAARLLQRACTLGGDAECRDAVWSSALKADWTLDGDGKPKKTGPDSNLELAALACERGSALLCEQAGLLLSSGASMAPDFEAATAYAGTACDLGNAKGCELQASLTGGDAAVRRKAELRWTYERYSLAASFPEEHPARIAFKAQYSAKTPQKEAEALRRACDLGEPMGCFYLAEKYERGSLYQIAPGWLEIRKIYIEACEKGQSMGCISAARRRDYGLSTYSYYGDSRALYEQACLEMGNAYGCELFGEMLEAENDIDEEAALIRQVYGNACTLGRKSSCERLAAFETKMTPSVVAERMTLKGDLAARNRNVPWGAYAKCAGAESQALGRAIYAGTGDDGLAAFVRKCGGTYIREELKTACAPYDGQPDHYRLLCSGVLAELEGDAALTAPGWRIDGDTLARHFKLWPYWDYLDQTRTDFILNPFDADGAVSNVSGTPPAGIISIPGEQVAVSVGDSVFRLVLQDDAIAVIVPVDATNLMVVKGASDIIVLEAGVTPADWIDTNRDLFDQFSMETFSSAVWDDAAGKWDVETATVFGGISAEDWEKIGRGTLYASLYSATAAMEADSLCCRDSNRRFVPFDDGRVKAFALKHSRMGRLYGGTITPEVAEAMSAALNVAQPKLWSEACGVRPTVSTAGMSGLDFDNIVDDYSLRREQAALRRRAEWYECQEAFFNRAATDANSYIERYGAASPTTVERWVAALKIVHFENHRAKLRSEVNTIAAYGETIKGAADKYVAEQRERRREARRLREERGSQWSHADEFYYNNSGARHLDCMSGAQSYSAQQACMGNWLNEGLGTLNADPFGRGGSASGGRNAGSGDGGYGSGIDVPVAVLTVTEPPKPFEPEPRPYTPSPQPESKPEAPSCPEGYSCSCMPPILISEMQAACR